MDYKNFIEEIKKNRLKPIYLCFGEENYLKDWIVTKLKEKFVREEFETLNYILLDDDDTSVMDIINACETLPFMDKKKIVVVEDFNYFKGGKTDKKYDEKELLRYIESPSMATCLFFLIKDGKIDGKKKIVKKFKKEDAIIEINRINKYDLEKWITKLLSNYDKTAKLKDIKYIVECTGYLDRNSQKTLYDVENEIIKLINFIGEKNIVEKMDIDMVLTKSIENNIFELVDGIGASNLNKSLKILNEMLLENEPIQLILYMIIRQFRLLLMSKLLKNKGYIQTNIAKKIGVPSYIAKKLINQSERLNIGQLEYALNRALDIDRAIKKGGMDSKLGVEMLIVETTKNIQGGR
ncbi:DNA polymerase III subunit delta [Clostridiisalibacter paucivorans]|uniref:DNA polymerase III subunit delta n=1 Tax=Clostridiisalibacter paucivorans TaxID=408753 RepID=UPI00047E57AD|nr:DNA polymerase III subunit delta [Clostridiisalibacter paucivorans]